MPSLTSDQIKASVANYYRYFRQFPLIAFESKATYRGLADIVVVSLSGHLTEIEAKTSMSDFKRDFTHKGKHKMYLSGNLGKWRTTFFYFAVPSEIAGKATEFVEQEAPYAGVLAVSGFGNIMTNYVSCRRKARTISKFSRRLSLHEMAKIAKDQSATLCRMATRICLLEKG